MIIKPIQANSQEGRVQLSSLYDRFQLADNSCRQAVEDILLSVKTRGDAALVEYTRKFDAPDFSANQIKVNEEEMKKAYGQVSADFFETLKLAINRIRTFHQKEIEESWTIEADNGVVTGQLVNPVDSAGLYVPGGQGGKTPLVSSVLMNGIPAGIAGVEKRVMATPADENGEVNPALLVAAQEIGITDIYKIGSAWAIAAMAFGTETVPRVDVIVGPGNQFVTEAKKQVSGMVRIDMIAGPSEVLVVADETADPSFIAADMLAQAEHDPQALAMVVTTSSEITGRINEELETQLAELSRKEIARASLENRGVILIAENLEDAISIANKIAAEHLELMIAEPWEMLSQIRHAGAIFLGKYSPEAVGDYLAGPNHVLPTMGTARFSSALGVETFVKKSSVISYPQDAFEADASHIKNLANLEGLTGHAQSVAVRMKAKKK